MLAIQSIHTSTSAYIHINLYIQVHPTNKHNARIHAGKGYEKWDRKLMLLENQERRTSQLIEQLYL